MLRNLKARHFDVSHIAASGQECQFAAPQTPETSVFRRERPLGRQAIAGGIAGVANLETSEHRLRAYVRAPVYVPYERLPD